MSLKGIGLKHDLMQYFKIADKIPINISAFASFSKMKIDYDIQSFSFIQGTGQISKFNLNNYNLLMLVSFDAPILNFYGSFGYSGGNSTFKMLGEYNLKYTTQNNIPVSKKLIDPIDMSFDVSDFQTSLGIKYKFLIFSASVDYTFQDYNTLSAGMSVNFR